MPWSFEGVMHLRPAMTIIENERTFFVLADEFFFAASELEKTVNPDKIAMASYYLYGHSLELAYKGFLFRCGVTLKELKRVGHDLQKALNLAKDKGICNYLCIDAAYETVVQRLNKYYFTKEFEYMTNTEKTFPLLMDVKDIVYRTINSLFTVLTEHL